MSQEQQRAEPPLRRIHVAGFRSLRDVSLEVRRINVLIGPNGAGKSNLLAALRLASLLRAQSLRRYVGEQGGASALLFYGSATTQELTLELDFGDARSEASYRVQLSHTARDAFTFAEELARWRPAATSESLDTRLGIGHDESRLLDLGADPQQQAVRAVSHLLAQLGHFHFHDTSQTSPLRQNSRMAEKQYLLPDGSNLAAFLWRLKNGQNGSEATAWNLIGSLLRRIAPFVKTLEPELLNPGQPEASAVRLRWTDERDHLFDVGDLSDGTLRALALITALAQPSSCRPLVIAIDEPELGLHPTALEIVCSLVSSVSVRHQVIVSTQSPAVLDYFEPQDVIVAERKDQATTMRRLDRESLKGWLEDYSLSELYGKNVLGGRP
jgi:predicted ATPase